MKVSVVICTYNRRNQLAVTLSALQYLRYRDFEVVVVLGPSNDGSEELLRDYEGKLKAVACDVANLSKARNIGIANSAGDIVAFLDDDGVPEPDWLDNLLIGYHSGHVGGVGGFIRDHTGVKFQAHATVCDRYGDSRDFDSAAQAQVVHEPGCDRYFSLTGCNSSFRRSVLHEIGGFDEEYAYFLDETDVCLRVVDAGYTLEIAGSAQVLHKYAASHLRNDDRIPKSMFLPCRSKAYFCTKFGRDRNEAGAAARIKRYVAELASDMKGLHESGKIDSATRDRLLDEIKDGVHQGIADAVAHPHGQHYLIQHTRGLPQPFLEFPTLRPAASRMRICLVSREYLDGTVGGIAVWTRLVAEGLAALGHEVSVITRATGSHPTVDFVNRVWVHRIVAWASNQQFPPLPDLPEDIRAGWYCVYSEALRINAHRGLDLISFPIWDLEGLACAASGHFKTIMSLHTTYGLALPHKPAWQQDKTLKAKLVDKMIAVEKQALQSGIPLLANSHAVVADIQNTYGVSLPPSTVVVPHGVEDYARSVSDAKSTDMLTILFVGRFECRKGIDLLLSEIPALLERHPAIRFVLAGESDADDGPINHKKEFLTRHKSAPWMDRVSFPGALPDDELRQAYADCDVFVAPSRYESFGLIFIEAFIFGKAVIGPDVGGVAEIIEDNTTGLLFKNADSTSLAAALDRLIEDADLRNRLGTAARQKFETEYTVDKMVRRLESFYQGNIGN